MARYRRRQGSKRRAKDDGSGDDEDGTEPTTNSSEKTPSSNVEERKQPDDAEEDEDRTNESEDSSEKGAGTPANPSETTINDEEERNQQDDGARDRGEDEDSTEKGAGTTPIRDGPTSNIITTTPIRRSPRKLVGHPANNVSGQSQSSNPKRLAEFKERKHDRSMVIVKYAGSNEINGTFQRTTSAQRGGSFQYLKDGPGPKQKNHCKVLRKDGEWRIYYQGQVLYTNPHALSNEPPGFGWIATSKGKGSVPTLFLTEILLVMMRRTLQMLLVEFILQVKKMIRMLMMILLKVLSTKTRPIKLLKNLQYATGPILLNAISPIWSRFHAQLMVVTGLSIMYVRVYLRHRMDMRIIFQKNVSSIIQTTHLKPQNQHQPPPRLQIESHLRNLMVARTWT